MEAQMVPQMVHASETCQMLLHPEAQQQPSELIASWQTSSSFSGSFARANFHRLASFDSGRSTSHWCNAFSSLLQTHLLQLLRHSLSELAGKNLLGLSFQILADSFRLLSQELFFSPASSESFQASFCKESGT